MLEMDDTPVYRETQLKEATIEWIKSGVKNREKDFKQALQKAEREIMSSFSYE